MRPVSLRTLDIRAMVARGCSNEQIQMKHGKAGDVAAVISRARNPQPAAQQGFTASGAPLDGAVMHRKWSLEQARAGIYHLVDLKREGYSPTRTELHIPADREQAARVSRPLAAVSFTGSQFE